MKELSLTPPLSSIFLSIFYLLPLSLPLIFELFLQIRLMVLHMGFQPARRNPLGKPFILVVEKALKVVDKFVNLGSTLSRSSYFDDEMYLRF